MIRQESNTGRCSELRDALTEGFRQGAQQWLAQATEIEVAEYLRQYRGLRDDAGRLRVVGNGICPPVPSRPASAMCRSRPRGCFTGQAQQFSM